MAEPTPGQLELIKSFNEYDESFRYRITAETISTDKLIFKQNSYPDILGDYQSREISNAFQQYTNYKLLMNPGAHAEEVLLSGYSPKDFQMIIDAAYKVGNPDLSYLRDFNYPRNRMDTEDPLFVKEDMELQCRKLSEKHGASIASADGKTPEKQYEIHYGTLGNGLTVWNSLDEKDHGYAIVAFICPDRTVSFLENDLPDDITRLIQGIALTDNTSLSDSHTDPLFIKPPLDKGVVSRILSGEPVSLRELIISSDLGDIDLNDCEEDSISATVSGISYDSFTPNGLVEWGDILNAHVESVIAREWGSYDVNISGPGPERIVEFANAFAGFCPSEQFDRWFQDPTSVQHVVVDLGKNTPTLSEQARGAANATQSHDALDAPAPQIGGEPR